MSEASLVSMNMLSREKYHAFSRKEVNGAYPQNQKMTIWMSPKPENFRVFIVFWNVLAVLNCSWYHKSVIDQLNIEKVK